MTDVMDPQQKQPKKSDLLVRSVSSVVLGPPVLVAVYLGSPYSDILIVLTGLILAWEWASLCGEGKVTLPGWFIIAALPALLIVGDLFGEQILIWLIPLSVIAQYIVNKLTRTQKTKSYWLCLGVLYLSLATWALLWLRNSAEQGLELVFWMLFVVWATDIGAYFSGKSIGGPKIAPKISPKKTWAGLVGGMLCAAIISYFYSLEMAFWNPVYLAVSGGGLAVVSQAGDFFESHMKRIFNAKDSSKLIPGHGGLLDRVDGLLACALFVFLIYSI